ncbi:hypothetical protein DFS34DRAFT_601075 [Phlyctochytrium arcticum]|nr:hypothetical protein DFS34DRAFT_601075 [Phlyctochytrium arcticum]
MGGGALPRFSAQPLNPLASRPAFFRLLPIVASVLHQSNQGLSFFFVRARQFSGEFNCQAFLILFFRRTPSPLQQYKRPRMGSATRRLSYLSSPPHRLPPSSTLCGPSAYPSVTHATCIIPLATHPPSAFGCSASSSLETFPSVSHLTRMNQMTRRSSTTSRHISGCRSTISFLCHKKSKLSPSPQGYNHLVGTMRSPDCTNLFGLPAKLTQGKGGH